MHSVVPSLHPAILNHHVHLTQTSRHQRFWLASPKPTISLSFIPDISHNPQLPNHYIQPTEMYNKVRKLKNKRYEKP